MGELDGRGEPLGGATQVLLVVAVDPRAEVGEDEPADAGSSREVGGLAAGHVAVALELGPRLDGGRLDQ